MSITKDECKGCEDNFYNTHKNCVTDNECWMFETAKLEVRKQVHIDQRPPWNQEPAVYPSCYHQKGYIFVQGDRTC